MLFAFHIDIWARVSRLVKTKTPEECCQRHMQASEPRRYVFLLFEGNR